MPAKTKWETVAGLDYEALFEDAATNAINPDVEAIMRAMVKECAQYRSLDYRWMPHTQLDDAIVGLAAYLTRTIPGIEETT